MVGGVHTIDQTGGMASPEPVLRATIKGHLEFSGDISAGRPTDPTYFGFEGSVVLGVKEDRDDLFDFFVCSPRWLADHYADRNPDTTRRSLGWPNDQDLEAVSMPGLILMPVWSEESLRSLLDRICGECTGPDWPTIASRLGRVLIWEYEYKYDEYVDTHTEQFRLPWGWTGQSWK